MDIQNAANDLINNGWAVVPDVIPEEMCDELVGEMWDWLEGFNPEIDRNDPSTFTSSNFPYGLHGGILQTQEIGHQGFSWKVRKHPNVIDVFSQLHGTNELLVSFDGVCIMRPSSYKYHNTTNWTHNDQSYITPGLRCIQGLVNLIDVTEDHGTLFVRDKSHELHDEIGELKERTSSDWNKLTEDELAVLDENECAPMRVTGPKGSMFLWDSRLCHQSIGARTPGLWRFVVYVCMQPRSLISTTNLAKKVKAYDEYRTTNHWPTKIKLFPKKPRTYGNEQLNPDLEALRTRDAVEDDVVLKLAGKKRYRRNEIVTTDPLLEFVY